METINIYSCTRLSAVVTLTHRKAEYTTDVWSLWKIAHGKVVSACVLKGSGRLSRPLSLPFPLQVCFLLLLFCFILFSVLMNIFLCIHKYYQAGMPIVPSRYHSHRVLLYTNVLSTVGLFFVCVYIFSFSAVASSLFLVL